VAVVADPEWVELAGSAGHAVRALSELPLSELRHAEAAVLRAEAAWERIRGWRAVGVSIGVIVVVDTEDAPEDRQRLEPLVLLRRTDADGFREAMERLRVGEATSRMELATGVADFHRGVFERGDGVRVRLTGLEVRLLAYLAARSFRVVGRQELQEQVWGYRATIDTRTVEVTVGRLRKKIRQDSVLTVRGEGYRAVRVAPPTTAGVTTLAAFRRAAHALRQVGRLAEAELMLDLHVNHRAPHDRIEEAEERIIRSQLHFALGDLPAAERAARRGVEAAREAGDPGLGASASVALVAALRGRDDAREIPGLLDRAWAAFELADDDVGRTRVLAMRADTAPFEEQLGWIDRALATFERGRAQFAEGMATRPQYGALLLRAGHLRLQARDLAGSESAYALSAEVHAVLGNEDNLATSRMGLATARFEVGDDEQGHRHLTDAVNQLSRLRNRRAYAAAIATRAMMELDTRGVEPGLASALAARAALGACGVPESVPVDLAVAAARLVAGDADAARAELAACAAGKSNHPAVHALFGWLRAAAAPDPAAWREAAASARAAMPPNTRSLRWAAALAQRSPHAGGHGWG
jgi:hypothetical protein